LRAVSVHRKIAQIDNQWNSFIHMVEKYLGEVVIRTPNMQAMLTFYRDVVELEPFKTMGTMQFFKVSDGLAGQAQAIGLFELNEVSDVDDTPFDGHDTRKTPFHHFAFIIDRKDYDGEYKRITGLGYHLRTMAHSLTQSRSFYLYDPDGNTVEFVCYDLTIPLAE
jgi:catechol 2,3-dioxygenase-like lactoylglutathione lyase family enzyme